MAFTSFDQLLSGQTPDITVTKPRLTQDTAPVLTSTFLMAGFPNPVAFAPGINGVALTFSGTQGELPLPNPGAGATRKLAKVLATNNFNYDYWLCDRLWHNSGLNVTLLTEQVMTPPALPARDINGASLGEGVWAAIEIDTAATNAAAFTNCTIRFTDAAGVAGKVGTLIPGFPTTGNSRGFLVFDMPAGSLGVRSIQGITLGTSLLTGSISLVLFRPIVMFGDAGLPSSPPHAFRFSALMLNAPTIPNGAVLFVVDSNANTGNSVHSLNLTFSEA